MPWTVNSEQLPLKSQQQFGDSFFQFKVRNTLITFWLLKYPNVKFIKKFRESLFAFTPANQSRSSSNLTYFSTKCLNVKKVLKIFVKVCLHSLQLSKADLLPT